MTTQPQEHFNVGGTLVDAPAGSDPKAVAAMVRDIEAELPDPEPDKEDEDE